MVNRKCERPLPVVLVVAVEDLVTDVALALAVVVVVEVPFNFGVVFVSVDCPVLLGSALAVPGEDFRVDFAVVERIRFVVFLVSFSGTGFAELDNGFRVTVEVGAGRVVVLGAGFAAVPFTLVVSVFSTFLAGAVTGLFAAEVVVVVAVAVVLAVAGLVVVGLLEAALGLVRGALGAVCEAGFGTFFSVGLGAVVAGFVVVVFGRGFAAGLAAAGCLVVGVVFDAVGLGVVVVFSAAGLVVDDGFVADLSGVDFFSAGFVAVLADGVVFAGVAFPGVDRADVGFPGLSAAAFVDFAGDLTTSGAFTSSCETTGMTTVPLLIRISSLFSVTGASTSGSGSLVTTGDGDGSGSLVTTGAGAGSGSTTLGSGTRIGDDAKTSATGGTGEDSTAGETETGSGSIMGETGAGEGSG